jgi:hypothetical protein
MLGMIAKEIDMVDDLLFDETARSQTKVSELFCFAKNYRGSDIFGFTQASQGAGHHIYPAKR